mgnify:FL=1
MKGIFKKNQFIVTFLAILIAVAGYLNYADRLDRKKVTKADNNTYDSVYSKDNLTSDNKDIESLDGGDEIQDETKEPGAAVLTNGNDLSSYMVQARLNREQTRSKNKETLLNVINNEAVSKSEKKKAVKSMVKITETNEMENTIESLLKAKGFNDVIVTVSDKQVDVVVSDKEIADNKRAQIEDVIKRKTGLEASAITITPAK